MEAQADHDGQGRSEMIGGILHVITSLETGGAEVMLLKLLEASGGAGQLVVTLCAGGALRPRFLATGAELVELGLKPGRPSLRALLALVEVIRRRRPDLVHGWMYHANVAALLAQRLSGWSTPVLWNIRHALHEIGQEKRATRAVIRAGGPLSHLAASIVYNSRASASQHEAIGYARRDVEVIPNGFDMGRFRPDPEARASVRAELGLAPSTVAVGLVARYHAVKDHATLVQAAGALRREGVDLALVMAGSGVEGANAKLAAAIEAAGVGGRAVLLGERADIPRVLAGLDVAVLCSLSEGFPNALGEAMACGLPCVATDVGDCRFLLGEGGAIVPPRDPAALADALRRLIGLPPEARRELGQAGRARIEREFALPSVAKHYEHLYDRVVQQARARS